MVLFTSNNISAPSVPYHIQTGGLGVNSDGTMNATILTIRTPVLNLPFDPNPSYVNSSLNVNGDNVTKLVDNRLFNTSAVNSIMSDGTTTTVFDNILTGLNTIEFMMSRNQYYLMASDDVMLINVDGVKLLILETTFMNQKLMNSFSFHYIRGKVRCIHRNLATIMDLTDALISVGYKKSTSVAFMSSFDLQEGLVDSNRPRIQIFDYNYIAVPSSTYYGSLLEDSPYRAINYVS